MEMGGSASTGACPQPGSQRHPGRGKGSLTFHRAFALLRLGLRRDRGMGGRGKALSAASGHPGWTCPPQRKRTHMLSPTHPRLWFQPHFPDNNH